MNEKINKSNSIMGLIRRTFTYIDAPIFLMLYKALAKTVFSVRNKLPATSALSKKKINGEEDEKIKFDPKIIPPRKSYSRHFEIVIALKKFTISSFK